MHGGGPSSPWAWLSTVTSLSGKPPLEGPGLGEEGRQGRQGVRGASTYSTQRTWPSRMSPSPPHVLVNLGSNLTR